MNSAPSGNSMQQSRAAQSITPYNGGAAAAPETVDRRAFLRDARDLQGKLEHSKQLASSTIFQLDGTELNDEAHQLIELRRCFLTMKERCRQLLKFKAEQIDGPIDRTAVDPHAPTALIQFEKTFEAPGINDRSAFILGLIRLTSEYDKIISRTIHATSLKIGADVLGSEYFEVGDDDEPKSGTQQLSLILSAAVSMGKFLDMLPRAENEFPAQIVALRRQLEVLHQELGRKNGECEHLQANLRAAKDANKQISYLRQQNTIENLESKLHNLTAENEKLYTEKIRLMESDGFLRDQLKDAKSELDILRQRYRKDVDETRSLLQLQTLTAQQQLQELIGIRKSAELTATRLILIENQNSQLSKTIGQLERKLVAESELLAHEREETKKHLKTIEVQRNVLLSAGSANMNFKKEIKALEHRIKCLMAADGTPDGIDYRAALEQAREREGKAIYNLRVLQGLQASLEFANKTAIRESEEFKRLGFTPEKKEAYERLQQSLSAQRDANTRLEAQLRTAMGRIRELEEKK